MIDLSGGRGRNRSLDLLTKRSAKAFVTRSVVSPTYILTRFCFEGSTHADRINPWWLSREGAFSAMRSSRRSATTPITSRQLPIDMRRTHGGYGVRKSGPRNDKPTLYAFFLCRQ